MLLDIQPDGGSLFRLRSRIGQRCLRGMGGLLLARSSLKGQ